MSENGPREGTRDLPRRAPEAGYRAADDRSATAIAFRRAAEAFRRRRQELLALAGAGGTASSIATEYERKHPLEPPVTEHEVEVAVRAARAHASPRPS